VTFKSTGNDGITVIPLHIFNYVYFTTLSVIQTA